MVQRTTSYSYSLPNINGLNKSGIMGWARHMSRMREMKNTDTIQENLSCVWFR